MEDPKKNSSYLEKWIERQKVSDVAVDISIVVPCFNEQWRLPSTLIDIIDYVDAHGETQFEIIVVDDGSTDNTSEIVAKFEKVRPHIKLLRVPRNYGKGHAVRTGVLNAHGKRILFSDADGATPIQEIARLSRALDEGADVAIGSRAKFAEDTKVTTNWHRKYLGRLFNFCVNVLVLPQILDTQCGFKMFTSRAGKFLFSKQSADGFSFDVEILLIARLAALKVVEVPINWVNVPGSKVNLILDPLRMFWDILLFKIRHRGISAESYSTFSE